MRVLKNLLTIIIVLIMTTFLLSGFSAKAVSDTSNITSRGPVKVGVLVYSDNVFSFDIAKNLMDIQKENENKVEFTLFNANSNPAIESKLLNDMLDDDYDLLLVNISGKIVPELIENSVEKARQQGIPLIFFDINPVKLDVIKKYSKSLIINNDSKQGGTLQGKMIVDEWNANKGAIDKNRDNILQYIMIKGESDSLPAQERTNYSIKAITDAGIRVQELASINANWDQELAKSAVDSLFLKYDGKIEAIIANNDSMAIGAVEALQKYGYNIGNKEKTIPVFGINSSSETEDLIKKGFMAGSVPRNPRTSAEVLYTVGMNLVQNKNPLENTNYKFDETGVTILIPFEEPKSQNIQR
jgi:methyl-galactoside transport system substrate-binding protein